MHRIVTPDGGHRQSRFIRVALTTAYLIFTIVGALIWFSPVVVDIYGPAIRTLALFLVVGGGFSALGAATQRWAGEFAGLPLLAVAFLSFGLEASVDTYEYAPLLATANLLLLSALALLMGVRWRAVFAVYRMARGVGRRE